MVRNPKNYQNAMKCGVEAILGYIFEKAENFSIANFSRDNFYEEINERSGYSISRKQFSNLFCDLKKNKYIEIEKLDNERSVKLTNKAKIKIIEQIINNKKKDRTYRYLSFDIPERLHSQRDLFRRIIKRMGCKQIQQSLWVIDKDIGEEVEMLVSELKISDYVAYIIAHRSNIDEHVDAIIRKNQVAQEK